MSLGGSHCNDPQSHRMGDHVPTPGLSGELLAVVQCSRGASRAWAHRPKHPTQFVQASLSSGGVSTAEDGKADGDPSPQGNPILLSLVETDPPSNMEGKICN